MYNNSVYSVNGGFGFRADQFSNSTDWKNFLSSQYENNTPVNIQYKTKELISTTMTASQLEQYKKLCEAFPDGTNLNDYLV